MLQQWARQTYGIRLLIVVIPHTFGRHLNFNSHLHILVSEGGLREDRTAWKSHAPLKQKALMPMWRYAVITLLREAATRGVLETDHTPHALRALLPGPVRTVVEYRRPALPEYATVSRLRGPLRPSAAHRPSVGSAATGPDIVRFVTKDTSTKRTVQTRYTLTEFLALLAHHVPDRYRHGVRLFGLLAPRLKHQTHAAIFDLPGAGTAGEATALAVGLVASTELRRRPVGGSRRSSHALGAPRRTLVGSLTAPHSRERRRRQQPAACGSCTSGPAGFSSDQ